MPRRVYLECPKCGKTRYDRTKLCCDVKLRRYTGGQAFVRKDGDFEWRFFVKGDLRASGTNPHKNVNDAIADFNEVMGYTLPTEEEDE